MSSLGNQSSAKYVTSADLEPSLQQTVSIVPYLSNRNRIINGAMVIDQRNNGASTSAPTAGAYTLDRWLAVPSGSAVSVQRITNNGTFLCRVTGAAGNTGFTLSQRVESVNIADLVGKKVTLSAVISSSVLTSVKLQYVLPSALDNYTTNTPTDVSSVTITSTPTRYSWTFVLPAGAGAGVAINFVTGAFTSGTLEVTDVQLEEGDAATPFERRPITIETMLCQRYYWVLTYDLMIQGYGGGLGANTYRNVPFPVRMRARPTITNNFYSPVNLNIQGVITSSADGFLIRIQSASPADYATTYTAGNTANVEL